jgi:hypothetical protein
MNEAAIAEAIGQRLAASPAVAPIAWENKDAAPARPYLRFELVRVDRRNRALTDIAPISRGYAVITVITEVDRFAKPAETLADLVAARFPYGLRLTITGGGVLVVISPASVLQGFRDGPDWRLPVRVDYEAFA